MLLKVEEEANQLYQSPNTWARLIEITKAFLSIENKTAYEVLGGPDDLKIKSSMTLFDTIQNEIDLFDSVLEKYFEGNRCRRTISGLKNE